MPNGRVQWWHMRVFAGAVFGAVLAHLAARALVGRRVLLLDGSDDGGGYVERECGMPLVSMRHRGETRLCGKVENVSSEAVSLDLGGMREVKLLVAECANVEPVILEGGHVRLSNLWPDTSYVLFNAKCRQSLHIPPYNPSFENVGDPPYVATRFRGRGEHWPRWWTPVYNGRVKRVCGVIGGKSGEVIGPRSGLCCMQIGGMGAGYDGEKMFHSVHRGVLVGSGGGVRVMFWYQSLDVEVEEGGGMEVVVGWKNDEGVDDGVVVKLREVGEWTKACVGVLGGVEWVHVYFVVQGIGEGRLFVDDFEVEEVGEERMEECHIGRVAKSGEERSDKNKGESLVEIRLKAEREMRSDELTVAVALTANRVLRLEALCKMWGGGVVAAVAVRNKKEAETFGRIWWKKSCLRQFVSVAFVTYEGNLAINALRNVAVQQVSTDFVLLLDVDMVPSSGFECVRDANWLNALLPKGEKRILTMPVFITDVHHAPAYSKSRLLQQLSARVATAYCLNSQRAIKLKRWYTETEAVQTRFITDFEPFGITRRDDYPWFDPRFIGYGFNKISWAVQAEALNWTIYILPHTTLTHLNHVENGWVSHINVSAYLTTWRRFVAFTAEMQHVT